MAGKDGAALHGAEPAFDGGARGGGDSIFAGLDGFHIHLDGAGQFKAEELGAAGFTHGVSGGDECLGWDAAGVDTGPAEELALDHGDSEAGFGKTSGERRAGLTGPDDDGIEVIWHWRLDGKVDDEEASDDGDEVFEEGGGEIVAEGFGQAAAKIGSGKSADDGSDGAKQEPCDEGLMGDPEGGSGEGSADDAGDELGRDLSAGCIRQLVIDDLAECENGEDVWGCRVAEPCEMGAGEIDPTEAGSPADNGRRG